MLNKYIDLIEKNKSIEIFCIYSTRCSQCIDWIKDILIPSVENFNLTIIDTDKEFIPFKANMSPSVFLYISGFSDPVFFDGLVTKEAVIGYLQTAKDIHNDIILR